jgi:hypothetical protein
VTSLTEKAIPISSHGWDHKCAGTILAHCSAAEILTLQIHGKVSKQYHRPITNIHFLPRVKMSSPSHAEILRRRQARLAAKTLSKEKQGPTPPPKPKNLRSSSNEENAIAYWGNLITPAGDPSQMLTRLFLAVFNFAGTLYNNIKVPSMITKGRPVLVPEAVHAILRGLKIDFLTQGL